MPHYICGDGAGYLLRSKHRAGYGLQQIRVITFALHRNRLSVQRSGLFARVYRCAPGDGMSLPPNVVAAKGGPPIAQPQAKTIRPRILAHSRTDSVEDSNCVAGSLFSSRTSSDLQTVVVRRDRALDVGQAPTLTPLQRVARWKDKPASASQMRGTSGARDATIPRCVTTAVGAVISARIYYLVMVNDTRRPWWPPQGRAIQDGTPSCTTTLH